MSDTGPEPSSGGSRHRRRAKKGEGGLLREQLLDAAEQILAETGQVRSLTVRRVADAVGVTTPSVYLHFADRAELVYETVGRQLARHVAALDEAVAGIADPVERMRRRGAAYIHFGLDNPEHYRVLYMGRAEDTPERFAGGRLIDETGLAGMLDDITAAIAQGGYPPQDPIQTACLLWFGVHGATSLLLAMPDFPWPPVDALIESTLDFLDRALGGRRDPATMDELPAAPLRLPATAAPREENTAGP